MNLGAKERAEAAVGTLRERGESAKQPSLLTALGHDVLLALAIIERLEEQLEALRASVEIVQSERDEAVGKLRSLGLAVVDAMCDQSSTCRATEHKPWCFGYQPAYGIGGNLPGAESTPASERDEYEAWEKRTRERDQGPNPGGVERANEYERRIGETLAARSEQSPASASGVSGFPELPIHGDQSGDAAGSVTPAEPGAEDSSPASRLSE